MAMKINRKHFDTIDSTNTWAKQQAPTFERNAITLVTAGTQTAGRGRFNRVWVSPPNQNIYATFCFFIEKHRTDIGNLPQIMALSAAKMMENLGFKPKLKWPNDVLLSNKKVAGILCETTPFSDQLCVILGIGINVNMPCEVLEKIDRPATSLLVEGGNSLDVEQVLEALQGEFVESLDIYMNEGFYPFLEPYKAHMVHSEGDQLKFHDNRKVWEGAFQGINTDGTLNVKLANGEIRTFVAGEILPE